MSPLLSHGWVVVPCDAPDTVPVEISVGTTDDFRPAFRDWHDGRRVAKVRPAGDVRKARAYLRIADAVTPAGIIT